jgi:hypothetical protein
MDRRRSSWCRQEKEPLVIVWTGEGAAGDSIVDRNAALVAIIIS